MSTRFKTVLASVSGILFLLSFPPVPLGFLAPISLSILLCIALESTKKEAFIWFSLAGAISAIGLLYWIPRLMQQGLFIVLAIGMVLLIAYMAVWFGFAGLLTSAAASLNRRFALICFPFIWTGVEKARELGEMSFPWIHVGYAYGPYVKLIQFLNVGGVYFYSLTIALTSSLLYAAYANRRSLGRAIPPLAGVVLLHGLLWLYGGSRITHEAARTGLRLSLVQANIDQNVKWDLAFTEAAFAENRKLTLETAASSPDLVVWSESAMPMYFLKRTRYREEVARIFDSLGVSAVLGGLDYTVNETRVKGYDFYNSIFFYAPGSRHYLQYNKIKLLPFAERLPFEGIFPILSRVDLGEADFSPGDSLRIFSVKGFRFFTPICYEVVYPEFIRNFANQGADFFLHITNDGWFGKSAMPFQHTNIARYRAVENGLWIGQCANTGVSCFIDPYGRISGASSIYVPAVVNGTIKPGRIPTFYGRHGDVVGWMSLAAAIMILGLALRRYNRSTP